MFVRILTSIAGHAEPRYGLSDFAFSPGDEVELADDLAQAWIDSGIAEPANPAKSTKRSAKPAKDESL